jgi:superfamily II DNA helicase RecQ
MTSTNRSYPPAGHPFSLFDKYEVSPSNRASCHRCHQNIPIHTIRYGIVHLKEPPREHYECYRFYHADCLVHPNRPLLFACGSGDVAEEVAFQSRQSRERQSLLRRDPARQQLLEELARWRTSFSQQDNIPANLIFSNTVLDDIAVDLPTTEAQLMRVKGVGEDKCRDYGRPILDLICRFRRTHEFQTIESLSTQDEHVEENPRQRMSSSVKRYLLQHDPARRDLRKRLMRLRNELASQLEAPNIYTFTNAVVDELTIYLPSNKEEMLAIRGIGSRTVNRFGDIVLELISNFKENHEFMPIPRDQSGEDA